MMFYLNQKSKEIIEDSTGVKIDQISKMDVEDLDQCIEKKIGKRLKSNLIDDYRLIGRGSVYIFLARIFGIETVDSILSKI